MNLRVSNLSLETDGESLRQTFERFGQVDSCSIIHDRQTRQPRGFALVEMPDDAQAQAALNTLSGQEFDGSQIMVEPADSEGGEKPGGREQQVEPERETGARIPGAEAGESEIERAVDDRPHY